MVTDRRAEQSRRGAAQPAVAAKHQDLCGGLVDDRERIALAVLGRNHPARKLNHRAGDILSFRQQIDGGNRLFGGTLGRALGAACVEAWERQRQR